MGEDEKKIAGAEGAQGGVAKQPMEAPTMEVLLFGGDGFAPDFVRASPGELMPGDECGE